jgi:hypothetical protein
VEVVLVHPMLVPFAFNFRRAVFAADFHSRKNEAQKYGFFGYARTFFSIFAVALIIFLFLSVN